MKSQTPNRHSQTNSSALISNFLSSSRSNQNIFHSSGWRMDFTFSRNSRDNRKWPGWRDGKFDISRSHFASRSSNGSVHSFFVILNVEKFFQITPSKTFPSIHSQTSPNPIPDQSQFRQSLPLKTKIQFYQNFLPAKRSANHSMFFRRL